MCYSAVSSARVQNVLYGAGRALDNSVQHLYKYLRNISMVLQHLQQLRLTSLTVSQVLRYSANCCAMVSEEWLFLTLLCWHTLFVPANLLRQSYSTKRTCAHFSRLDFAVQLIPVIGFRLS